MLLILGCLNTEFGKLVFISFYISNNIVRWHFCKYFEKDGAYLIRQHLKLPSSILARSPLVSFLLIKKKKGTHILNTQLFFFIY